METEGNQPISIADQVFENRVIVLMEDIEEGIFYQVMFGETQYKKLSDLIMIDRQTSPELKHGMEKGHVHLEDDRTWKNTLFEGVKSHYSDKEVECDDNCKEPIEENA